jgi:hypothetical protein
MIMGIQISEQAMQEPGEKEQERVYRWRPRSRLDRLGDALGALLLFCLLSLYVWHMEVAWQTWAGVPPPLGSRLATFLFYGIPALLMFKALRPTSMKEVVVSPAKGVIFRHRTGKEKPVIADVTRVKGPGWPVLSLSERVVIEGRSLQGKKVRARVDKGNLEPGEFPRFLEDIRRLAPPTEAVVRARPKLLRGCAWVTNLLAALFFACFVLAAKFTATDYASGITGERLTGGIIATTFSLFMAMVMALLSVLLAERMGRAAAIWGGVTVAALIAGAIIVVFLP